MGSGVVLCSSDGTSAKNNVDEVSDTDGVKLAEPVFHTTKLLQAVSEGELVTEIAPLQVNKHKLCLVILEHFLKSSHLY